MSNVVILTSENFDEVTSQGLCLVEFWAEWCGPCKMLSPILDEIADEYELVVAKANVDEVQDKCMKFGVRNVPVIFIMRDGEVVNQMNGMQNKSKIIEALEKA